MKKKPVYLNCIIMLATVLCCFGICLLLQHFFEEQMLVPSIFILGIFLVSVFTDGFVYGILASVISMLAVNYAFAFPFFKINFSIPENLISAVIMVVISLVTCFLTRTIKYQDQVRAEGEKERMRANLLRAVSHDFRTPLTTIYGASSAMLEPGNEFTEEQKAQMLLGIKQDSQWLYRMVENLLSVTRLDGGKVKLIKTSTVLDELIDSVLVKLQKRYGKQNILVDLPEEMVIIPMDAILIEQVLINLLENAVLHAEGWTQISLQVFTIAEKAIFQVQDDGCGIPEEKLKSIFTAGIGLSVCATIVKAHGGDITIQSPKTGGTIVRFTLDMEEETDGKQ